MKPLEFKLITPEGKDISYQLKDMSYVEFVNSKLMTLQYVGMEDCDDEKLFEQDKVEIIGKDIFGFIELHKGVYKAIDVNGSGIDVLRQPKNRIRKIGNLIIKE
jgi:hypothetical protein